MHFSKLAIASILALASSVASQVVVTVTSTVTVVTVTVTPLSTSTSTVVVTVTGKASTTPSTRTATVTVTATPPPMTSPAACPLGVGGSCGLWNPAPGGCRQCEIGLTCQSILWSSSRCETESPSVVTYTSTIYKEKD